MNTQLKILLYFDERGIINDMKKTCIKFIENHNNETLLRKFPPVQYLLRLDVMNILDFFPDLGDFLLREPLMWQKMCTEIFYACLKSCIDNNVMSNLIEFSQAIIKIRLRSVPAFLYPNNKGHTYNNIIAYTGLLIDVSKPSDYPYYTVWSCPEECEGNEIILHHVTKIPPKCFVCRSTLYENRGLRKYCDQVTATFQINHLTFSKTFVILDDLIHELKLGAMYNIHAVVLKKNTTVWSVEEVVDIPLPLTSPICPDIEELYSKWEGVAWKFIYSLAIRIGSNIPPLNSFMNVKINLLMSVASIKAFKAISSPIIHFLASGHDTGYVGRLMLHAAQLTDRHVVLGTSNTSAITALLAASSGVCVMPLPLQALNQKLTHSIITAIETGEITHGVCRVKLKCVVWAHGMDLKKMMIHNVNSVFQNISRGDYGEHDDELSAFNIQQAVEPVTMFEDEEILKSVAFYLDTVAGITVALDLEAEILLRDYFLAARKERPKYVTSGTMKSLVNVCVTSARICRRSVANLSDATFAIWLHASGIPEPRFVPSEYLDTPADLTRLQQVMERFQEWLEQFIGICIPNTYK